MTTDKGLFRIRFNAKAGNINSITVLSYRIAKKLQINHDYEVGIKFRISVEQYMRIAA